MPSLPRLLALFACLVLFAVGCQETPEVPDPGPHKEIILPEGATPSSLLSPVVRTGDLLFLSGVIGTGDDIEGVEEETRRVLERIQERLATADATMEDVVKCTVFLIDMDDYDTMNGVYQEFFSASPPARSAIAVRELPFGALVEIECIAAAP